MMLRIAFYRRSLNSENVDVQWFFLSLQAHVVSAFEQSLSNMSQRLQQLTATAERKVYLIFQYSKYISYKKYIIFLII